MLSADSSCLTVHYKPIEPCFVISYSYILVEQAYGWGLSVSQTHFLFVFYFECITELASQYCISSKTTGQIFSKLH